MHRAASAVIFVGAAREVDPTFECAICYVVANYACCRVGTAILHAKPAQAVPDRVILDLHLITVSETGGPPRSGASTRPVCGLLGFGAGLVVPVHGARTAAVLEHAVPHDDPLTGTRV